MNRFLILLCVALLAAMAQAADVPVENGDFEQVNQFGKAVGWSSFRFDEDFGTAEIDGNVVATGKYGVVVGQTISGAQIKAGYRYTLSFDAAKTDGGGMYVFPVLWAVAPDGTSDYLNKSSFYPDIYIGDISGGLQSYSIGINAPVGQEGHEIKINLYIMSYNVDWDSTVYVDNVRLEEWLPTPGDLNYDRTVDLLDFAILSQNWMKCNILPVEVCDDDSYVLAN